MSQKKEILSIQEARKIVLLSQRIPPTKENLSPLDSTQSVIEQLGYIQIDTISVIQRAHHHTIWSRNPRYELAHLDDLMANKQIFEYWSHAAAYLPMKDYKFSLPRKQAIANGSEKYWYTCSEPLKKMILDRIKSEGPLMAKDFDSKGEKLGDWQTKPAKQALEILFMQGKLMIAYRTNFHKVYDLSERVLPDNIDNSVPSTEEYIRYLILRYLRANGIGQASEMAYLLKNTKALVSSILKLMSENGELEQVAVRDKNYYALTTSLQLLNKPLSRSRLSILSPFDNLVIQRKRIMELFDFDYILECYVPAAKRKYGYFTLPILWNGKLLARMDCKADRKTGILSIHELIIESSLKKTDEFIQAFSKQLESFLVFNVCKSVRLLKVNPTKLKGELQKVISTVCSLEKQIPNSKTEEK